VTGHRVPAAALRSFVVACLTSAGVTDEDAGVCAEVLVQADLRGIDSHGVARLRRYVDGIRQGRIAARAEVAVVAEAPAMAVLDAGNGLGQPAGVLAMRLAMDKAAAAGLGMVTVRRSNHFGIAGYYAMLALERDQLGFATTNSTPQVAPTFGVEPMFGTNPLAFALPTGGVPFVLDMATSTVPRGRLERMLREGRAVPESWAIDAEGRGAGSDLEALVSGLQRRAGFALLPLGGPGETNGGHKGYGLGLLVDLLCGPLSGASWGRHVYGPAGAGIGHVFMAVDVGRFRPIEEFRDESSRLLAEVRASRRLPGGERILVPGEREAEESARRAREGIPLGERVWADLAAIAAETGVPAVAEDATCA
jgi:L-2-hydroxycarboxylate dehydrogenase (NAD+)